MQKVNSSKPTIWPVIVVGAGPAGLMAAIFASRSGVPVLLLDGRKVPGAKIRISGGGRCNVLPSQMELSDYYSSASSNILRNILLSWPLKEVHRFFEQELHLPLKVESTGKVFPKSDRSQDVLDALQQEVERLNICVAYGKKVVNLSYQVNTCSEIEQKIFCLTLENHDQLLWTHRVVLACGGLSMPKTGSDGSGYRLARALGHSLKPTYPALVPLLGGPDGINHGLSGLSLPCQLKVVIGKNIKQCLDGDFLFTHKGFSGPVVLNISRYFTDPQLFDNKPELRACWGEKDLDWPTQLKINKGSVSSLLRQKLPKRLAQAILDQVKFTGDENLAELPFLLRQQLEEALQNFLLPITGSEGYKTAEVTMGGIPLHELNSKTLESRKVPGLMFAGEMLDVTGALGGYNFHWAWVSGYKVGLALAKWYASVQTDIHRR